MPCQAVSLEAKLHENYAHVLIAPGRALSLDMQVRPEPNDQTPNQSNEESGSEEGG
jgi:hypothetical protein